MHACQYHVPAQCKINTFYDPAGSRHFSCLAENGSLVLGSEGLNAPLPFSLECDTDVKTQGALLTYNLCSVNRTNNIHDLLPPGCGSVPRNNVTVVPRRSPTSSKPSNHLTKRQGKLSQISRGIDNSSTAVIYGQGLSRYFFYTAGWSIF